MVALKNPKRTSGGTVVIGAMAFRRLEKAAASPPKANKALKDLIRKGERLTKKG